MKQRKQHRIRAIWVSQITPSTIYKLYHLTKLIISSSFCFFIYKMRTLAHTSLCCKVQIQQYTMPKAPRIVRSCYFFSPMPGRDNNMIVLMDVAIRKQVQFHPHLQTEMKEQTSISQKKSQTDIIVLTAQDSLAQGDYPNQMAKRRHVYCGVETKCNSLPSL